MLSSLPFVIKKTGKEGRLIAVLALDLWLIQFIALINNSHRVFTEYSYIFYEATFSDSFKNPFIRLLNYTTFAIDNSKFFMFYCIVRKVSKYNLSTEACPCRFSHSQCFMLIYINTHLEMA